MIHKQKKPPKLLSAIKKIFDAARNMSREMHIDEKSSKLHPGVLYRKPSPLSYEEAFEIISKNVPYWTIIFRNESYLNENLPDYWEFGGCNLSTGDYGEVFIFISVDIESAEKIFKKFKLQDL